MKPQLLISAAMAGSGKTLFVMGLSRALKKRGMKVQPYKCGPDFIDTQLHSVATDNDSINLDLWMSSRTHVQHLYNKYGEKADVCLTEGVGALFDGYYRMQGSSVEIAQALNLPVILLINARMAGYSIAPLLYGYKHFYSGARIVGVIFNQVASLAHFTHIREACADAGVDCLGYLPYSESFKQLPSKHSVLANSDRQLLNELSDQVAAQLEQTVDVDRLLSRCARNFPCEYSLPYYSDTELDGINSFCPKIRIAVARDPAFSFIYKENIARLEKMGYITYFSPLYSSGLPEADLVYLPGGYPELFARQLQRRHKMLESLKEYAERGGKILAECGGMALLGRTLKSREEGTAYAMSHILPLDFVVPGSLRLQSGYRKVVLPSQEWKGYDFHYSILQKDDTSGSNRLITNMKGTENIQPLYRYKNVIASYTHWYWGDKEFMKLWE